MALIADRDDVGIRRQLLRLFVIVHVASNEVGVREVPFEQSDVLRAQILATQHVEARTAEAQALAADAAGDVERGETIRFVPAQ